MSSVKNRRRLTDGHLNAFKTRQMSVAAQKFYDDYAKVGIQYFCETTPLHGFYALYLSRHWWKRALWASILIGSIVLAIYQIGKVVDEYYCRISKISTSASNFIWNLKKNFTQRMKNFPLNFFPLFLLILKISVDSISRGIKPTNFLIFSRKFLSFSFLSKKSFNYFYLRDFCNFCFLDLLRIY